MIKYIFFDIYQTLLDVDIEQKNIYSAWSVFEDYLIKKNVDRNAASMFKSYFDEAEIQFYKKHDKLIHHHDWIDNVYSVMKNHYNLSISSAEARSLLWDFRKASCDYCRVYPGVKTTLAKLSKKYILSTASLAHGSITKIELEKSGIARYFSHLIFTSEIGYRKPSEEFYKRMLQTVGAKASESVMIGDNLHDDIYGAHRVGMLTIWIKNTLSVNKKADIEPDHAVHIQDFTEIEKVIARLETSISQ